MRSIVFSVLFMACMLSVTCLAAESSLQSPLNPSRAQAAKEYPQIVLYSVAWCPHCKEAKEYFTRNNIPFINRDVEVDTKAMEDLTEKYNSNAVPVIVIGAGKNELVVKGFTPSMFQESLKKVQIKN